MSFYARISLIIVFVFAFGFGSDAFSQRRRPAPRPAPRHVLMPPVTANLTADQKRRVESFDKAWRTIYYYYFDPKFNNVNWEQLKAEYEPKVLAAKSDEQLHELLDTMIGRLQVSHLGIIRPSVYEAIKTAKETARERAALRELEKADTNGDETGEDLEDETLDFDDPLSIYGPGFDLRIIGNRFVVFRIAKDSAAEYVGIKPGFIIESVDDVSLSLLLARVALLEKGVSRVSRYLPTEVVKEMLNGEKNSTVEIGYIDENDQAKEVVVRREWLRTQSVSMGSDVPESQLYFESRSIDADTGYIYFDNFSLPVIEKFCTALTDFKGKKSLVIDLRGNLGGVIGVSTGLAGMLSDKPMSMGTSIFRYGPEPLMSQPKAKRFSGRIVVLTDGLSVSAAEMFAVALQSSGRAQVIGERSAGETLPAVAVELPTGARLFYPIANFRAPNGKFLEGFGVVPDKVVMLDRASLIKGVDPQLAAALATLNSPSFPPIGGSVPVEFSGPVKTPPVSISVSGNVAAPPPPPPAPKKPLPTLGTVTVKAPAAPPEPPNVIEPKALALLTEFEKLSGGHAAYKAISSYEMAGSVETVSMGSRDVKDYKAYRDGAARLMTVFHSRATGEIKDVRDGKKRTLKSDFGIELEIPFVMSVEESDFIFVITEAMKADNYVKLLYLGVFDRKDRKVHLIDGETKEGTTVAIYFDTETKMLAGFEGPTGGLSFGDYRKVGNLMMPHNISSQDFLDIRLDEIKLNTKIDPAVFERKINCYDTPE